MRSRDATAREGTCAHAARPCDVRIQHRGEETRQRKKALGTSRTSEGIDIDDSRQGGPRCCRSSRRIEGSGTAAAAARVPRAAGASPLKIAGGARKKQRPRRGAPRLFKLAVAPPLPQQQQQQSHQMRARRRRALMCWRRRRGGSGGRATTVKCCICLGTRPSAPTWWWRRGVVGGVERVLLSSNRSGGALSGGAAGGAAAR